MSAKIVSQLEEALRALPVPEGDYEPMVNMAVHMLPDGNMEAVIIPRRAHLQQLERSLGTHFRRYDTCQVILNGYDIDSHTAFGRDWIMGRPDAFCAQAGPDTLRQVLNDYDLATKDFYRWSVRYTRLRKA